MNPKHRRVLAVTLVGLGCIVLFSAAIHRGPRPAEDAASPPTAGPVASKPPARPVMPAMPPPRLAPLPKLKPPTMDDYVVIPDDPRPQVFPAYRNPEAFEVHSADYGNLPRTDASRATEGRRDGKAGKRTP